MRRDTLPALTGLRFIAALLVVCTHFGQTALPGVLRPIAFRGFTGVSLFFVLSGFILTYTYARSGVTSGAFWLARFARIYPAYLGSLAVASGPLIWNHDLSAWAAAGASPPLVVATTPLLLQAWLPWVHSVWNGPAWTLSAEAFFYALFPLLLARLLQVPKRSLPLIILACFIASLLGPTIYGLATTTRNPTTLMEIVKFWPLMHLPEFVSGMAFACMFLAPLRLPAAVAAALSCAACGALVYTLNFGTGIPSMYLFNGLLTPLFGLLILSLAYGRGPLARILSTPPMLAAGEASYSMYLLHWPIHAWIERITGTSDADAGASPTFFIGYLTLTILCALVLYATVEVPARRWIRSRFARSGRQAAHSGSPESVPISVPQTTGTIA